MPLRLIDANGNRAAEGLRVLEDLARFLFDDARLSALAKDLRHRVRALIPPQAITARDVAGDVGTTIKAADEHTRTAPVALIRANAARVQEALRTAEEACKLAGFTPAAAGLETIRYDSYRLESALLTRLSAWRLWQVRLYALVDTSLTEQPVAVAAAVVRGGAGAVQLRAKNLGPAAYLALAREVQAAVRAAGGLFIVNDHAAIAAALGADGIHVGQDDLPPAAVRAVVGPACALGLSAHTEAQARNAVAAGADYLGLGPMFATTTKPHEPERGPGLLDAVKPWLGLPSYAIGGLNAERLSTLRPRLPHGAAIAGALCKAADPQLAAQELLKILQPEEE